MLPLNYMEAKLAAGIEIISKKYMYEGYPGVYRSHLNGDLKATYGLAEHFHYGIEWPNSDECDKIFYYLVNILNSNKVPILKFTRRYLAFQSNFKLY